MSVVRLGLLPPAREPDSKSEDSVEGLGAEPAEGANEPPAKIVVAEPAPTELDSRLGELMGALMCSQANEQSRHCFRRYSDLVLWVLSWTTGRGSSGSYWRVECLYLL